MPITAYNWPILAMKVGLHTIHNTIPITRHKTKNTLRQYYIPQSINKKVIFSVHPKKGRGQVNEKSFDLKEGI